MVYTSYFSKIKDIHNDSIIIGISRFPPKNINNNYFLAPSVGLLNDYKQGLINIPEYITRYKNEVSYYLTNVFIGALKELMMENRDIILCCYESSDKFCHRHILADLIRGYGINVNEYKEEING